MNSKKPIFQRAVSVFLAMALTLTGIFTANGLMEYSPAQAASFSSDGTAGTLTTYNKANYPTLVKPTSTTTSKDTLGNTINDETVYYLNGNAYYGVTDNSGGLSGSRTWELVDTDGKYQGGTLNTAYWSSTNTNDGSTRSNAANDLTDTYLTGNEQAAMKKRTVSAETKNFKTCTGTATGSVSDATMWPLSVTQVSTDTTLNTASSALTPNTLGTLLTKANGSVQRVWTRTFAGQETNGNNDAWMVYSNLTTIGFVCNTTRPAVVPACFLDLEKTVLVRDASTGATAPQNFGSYTVPTGKSAYKFLLSSSGYNNGFTWGLNGKSISGWSGKTYTISYSGATTSGTNYISAILYDSNGKIVQYGKLGTVSGASGSVDITLPRVSSNTTYTLAVFEETENAAYYSDYASNLQTASLTVKAMNSLTKKDSSGATKVPTQKLNTNATVTYTFAGNDWYGVTDGTVNGYIEGSDEYSPCPEGCWELVDTDAKFGNTNLIAKYNTKFDSGCTLLSATDSMKSNLGSAYLDAIKTVSVSTDTMGLDMTQNIGSDSYSSGGLSESELTKATVQLYPLSAGQLTVGYIKFGKMSGNMGDTLGRHDSLAANTLGRAISKVANSPWTRSSAGYVTGVESGDVNRDYEAYYINGDRIEFGTISNLFKVTPAFNLDLTKVFISPNVQQAFGANSLSPTKISLLAGDGYINNFAVTIDGTTSMQGLTLNGSNKNASAYDLAYSNAKAGDNIVVMLSDSTGAVKYYGTVATADSTSGYASLDLSGVTNGEYTMVVFDESSNGVSRSNAVVCTLTVGDTYYKSVSLTNNNPEQVSANGTLSAENVTGTYTVNDDSTVAVGADDIYVISAADWDENPSASNGKLAKTIVADTSGATFTYYIVVKNNLLSGGYYVSDKITVSCEFEKGVTFNSDTMHTQYFAAGNTYYASDYSAVIDWNIKEDTTIESNNTHDDNGLYLMLESEFNSLRADGLTAQELASYKSIDFGDTDRIPSTATKVNIAVVYLSTIPTGDGYYYQTYELTSTDSFYITVNAKFNSEDGKAEYGSVVSNDDFDIEAILNTTKEDGSSNDTKKLTASTYVLPYSDWEILSDETKKNEALLKSVDGVNSVIIPSDGAETFDVAVITYDYSETPEESQKNARSSENFTEILNPDETILDQANDAVCHVVKVTVPLAAEAAPDYESYTESGVTWYYNTYSKEGSDKTYAVNVHTLNEDISQLVSKDGVFKIPSEVNGYTVLSIGSGKKSRPFVPANVNSYTSIEFPDQTIAINDYAFYNSQAYVRLVVPKTISKIGNFAFFNCDNYSTVEIQCATTDIGKAAFSGCDGIENLTINSSTNTTVDAAAFAICTNLKKVVLTGKVNINKSAFTDCKNLDALNLSNWNGTIGNYAFNNCTSLKTLYIPGSSEVMAYAFNGCTGLKKLEIDSEIVKNHSFENCYNLAYVIFGKDVETVEYNWGGTNVSSYGTDKTEALTTEIYVKNGATNFETYTDGTEYYSAFMGHSNGENYFANNRAVTVFFDQTTGTHSTSEDTYTISAYAGYYSSEIGSGTEGMSERVTANGAISVTFNADNDAANKESLAAEHHRDGITAFYNGKVYKKDGSTIESGKLSVSGTYADAVKEPEGEIAKGTSEVNGFYFYNEKEADNAIRSYIAKGNYSFADVYTTGNDKVDNYISDGIANGSSYSYTVDGNNKSGQIAYDYDTFTYLITDATAQTAYGLTQEQYDKMMADLVLEVFKTKADFLTATASILDEGASIVDVPEKKDYAIQTITVIFYPEQGDKLTDDSEVVYAGSDIYYTTEADIRVVRWTEEDAFFDAGFTYATVMEAYNNIKSQTEAFEKAVSDTVAEINAALGYEKGDGKYIDVTDKEKYPSVVDAYNAAYAELKAVIDGLSGSEAESESLQEAIRAAKLAEAEMNKAKAELAKVQADYNKLVATYKELLENSVSDTSGYITVITGEDGIERSYVLIGSKEYECTDTGFDYTDASGNVYDIYSYLDGEETHYFYVDKNGVHEIILKADSGNVTDGELSGDIATGDIENIEDKESSQMVVIQRKLFAQISNLSIRLKALEDGLSEIANDLSSWIEDYNEETFSALTDEEKLTKIKAAINALKDALSKAESDYASKSEAYDKLVEANEKLQATYDALVDTYNSLDAAHTALQTSYTDLSNAKTELQTAYDNLNSTYNSLTDTYNGLSSSYDSLSAAYEELGVENENVKAAKEALDASYTNLQSSYTTLQTSKTALETAYSELEKSNADLQDSYNALQEANTNLQNSYQLLQDSNTALQDANKALTDELAGANAELTQYKTALKNIRKALGLVQTGDVDISDIEAEISDISSRLDNLVAKMNEVISRLEELGLNIDLTGNETDLQKLDALYTAVAKLLENYKAISSDYSAVVKKIYGADDTVDLSTKTLDEILNQIDSLSGDTTAIAAQLEKALTGNDVTPEQAQTLTALYGKVEVMRTDLEGKTNLLKDIMDALGVTDSAQILQKIADLNKQVADLTAENAKLKANGGSGSSTSGDYNTGYNAGYAAGLQAGSGSTNTTITSLTTQVNTLTSENKELTSTVNTLQDGIDEVYEEVLTNSQGAVTPKAASSSSNYANKLSKIKTYYTTLSSNYQKVEEENEVLTEKNETLTATNKELKEDVTTYKKKYNTYKKKYDTVKSEKATLAQTNTSLKNKNASLSNQVSSLENQVVGLRNSAPSNIREEEPENGTSQEENLQDKLPTAKTYTVTFLDEDGTELSSEEYKSGETIQYPEDPVKDGYSFVGWSGNPVSAIMDYTLTAQYEENSQASVGGEFVPRNDEMKQPDAQDAISESHATDGEENSSGADGSTNGILANLGVSVSQIAAVAVVVLLVGAYFLLTSKKKKAKAGTDEE